MIIIKKSANKKFYVVITGENGEPLSTSELLNSKQAAWKNIKAQWDQFLFVDSRDIENSIQDDTKKKK